MKQTAVEMLIEYFLTQQKEGCSHWCIHDLIAQLYVFKEIEKEQIIEAHGNKLKQSRDEGNYEYWFSGLDYYNKAFKKTDK